VNRDGSLEDFDLNRFLRNSKRVDLGHIEWSSIRDYELTDQEARVLTYMMDIESHTIIFLRDLLATTACLEPDVTAFLSCWAYEEYWHGEAFSRFLGEAGRLLPPDMETVNTDSRYPSRMGRVTWIRGGLGAQWLPYIVKASAAMAVRDFSAVHMAWGAVNELSTLTAYGLLASRTENRVLAQLLRAIIKDERRHYAFYRAQAELRLRRSRRAQAVTRFALRHLWKPVGTGVRPQQEVDNVVVFVFDDEAGRSAIVEMDHKVQSLPGLGDLSIFSGSLRAARMRAGVG
jgi:rubrerythrin